MPELIDVPWSAVWLLMGGGALMLIGGRVGAGSAGTAAMLLMIGAVIISVLADAGLSPLAAGLALLIHGVAAAGEATDESLPGRNAGLRMIAFAGFIGVAGSDSVPIVCLSLLAVSIGLHAAVLDATPHLRNLLRSSLRFHLAALLLVLLGSVVLCATAGTIVVTVLYGTEMGLRPAAGPKGGILLAEVALLIGACGFAAAGAVRWSGGRMAERCSAALQALWLLLPPLAGGLLLLRLFPALARLRAEGEVVPLIGLCLMTAWGGWLVWRERRVRPLLNGLSLLVFGVWLLGIAVAAWDAAQANDRFRAVGGLPDGSAAALACITADAVALLGLSGVWLNLRQGDQGIEHLEGLSGLIRQRPVAAITLLLCLLSLCGVPPLPGFWGRWFLSIAAWTPHHVSGFTGLFDPHLGLLLGCLLVLAAQLVIAATILRALQSLLLDEPLGHIRLRSRSAGAWTGWLLVGMLVVNGVWPGAWLRRTMNWAASTTLPDPDVAAWQPDEALESTTHTPPAAASR